MRRIVCVAAVAAVLNGSAYAQEVRVGINLPYAGVAAEIAQQMDRGMELYLKLNADKVKPYTIRLMAYGPDDESEQLGSWTASPGKEVKMSGLTHFTAGTLSRLALVRTDDRTLLSYDVP